MKYFFRYVFVLLFIVSVNSYTTAQSIDIDKLDAAIAQAVEDFDVPGLAIGIVKDGEVVLSKGYGVKDVNTEAPVTPQTVFGIASVSKAFTAASIGTLVDEGLLDWDDRVIDHLPNLKLYDPYVTRELRIRDLLSHHAGYRTFDGDLLWYGTDYSRKEIVERFGKLEPEYSFRIRYGYSNLMFIIAGEVIEAVTGKTWETYVTERILKPLGMKYTTVSTNDLTDNENAATPHINKEPIELLNYDNAGPAASLNSCVEDLQKWLSMWLNKGELNDIRIVSKDVVSEVLTSQTALSGGAGDVIGGRHFTNAGMGWFLADYAGRKIVSHGGGLPGMISNVTFVPEDDLAVVILTNDDNRLPGALTYYVLDKYFGKEDEDRLQKAKEGWDKRMQRVDDFRAKRDSMRVEGTSLSLPVEDYAGTYVDDYYGTAEITNNGGSLTLKFVPAQQIFTGELTHWHHDTFEWKHNDPFLPTGLVTFHFDSEGKIKNFTVDLPNPDFHFFNLDFEKK